MDVDIINDIRNDFKNITFSNFQKSKTKNELLNCIYNNKIENANYWTAELICSGHFLDLWDIIILYTTKYIHSGNPKLAIYLKMRYDNFINILENGYQSNIILLRNNTKIRKLFSEIICVLCFSNKKHNLQQIKLNKNEDFNIINISSKFKAPNTKFADIIFKEDDPKDLFIPINEMIYSLSIKNIIDICFWYEWIIEYEIKCKKDKKKCEAENRVYAPKYFQKDIIWIIWDILFNYAQNIKDKPILSKIIDSLFQLFVIKYKPTYKIKRKYILYFAFSLFTENIDFNINIIQNIDKIHAITEKINNIYKEIKKNEITPKTDYLFKDIKKSNIEKSIEKLTIFNSL